MLVQAKIIIPFVKKYCNVDKKDSNFIKVNLLVRFFHKDIFFAFFKFMYRLTQKNKKIKAIEINIFKL